MGGNLATHSLSQTASKLPESQGYKPMFMKDGDLYESSTTNTGPKGSPETQYTKYNPPQQKQSTSSPYPGTWNQNMTSGYPSSMMPSMYGQQQYGNVRHPSPQFGGPSTSTVTQRPMGTYKSRPQSEGPKGGRVELSNPSGTFGTLQPQGQMGGDVSGTMELKPGNPYYNDYNHSGRDIKPGMPFYKDYNGGVRSQPAQRFSQLGNYGANPVMSKRQRRPGNISNMNNFGGLSLFR